MNRLLKRAAGTLGLRLSYTLFTFLTSIVLARLLGPTGFGTYTYTISWSYLLAIPATLGFDGLLGREIAVYHTKFAWRYIGGLLRWANTLAFISAIIIATGGILLSLYMIRPSDPQLFICLCVIMAALPVLALRNIRRASMRGLHQIVLGLCPEMLIAPVLLLVFVGIAVARLGEEFTAVWAVGAYTLATVITLIISASLLDRSLPFNVKTAIPSYQRLDWLKQAWPFMFLESIHVVNARADVLMLGQLNGLDAAGIYAPVNRGAQLIIFILMAFNGPLSPTIASLYAEGKRQELQKILSKTARVCLLVSAIATVVLLGFGQQYLTVFGPEFVKGLSALQIRCVGQLLHALVGLAPMVLSMTGHTRFTAATSLMTAVLNIALNFLLIPRYGINGAAIATTTSILVSGIVNTVWVYVKIGVHPNIFGFGSS